MRRKPSIAPRRVAVEELERRRLLIGQVFPGEGPVVDGSPRAIVTADFNGDNAADLATA